MVNRNFSKNVAKFQNVCKMHMIVNINKSVSPKGLNNLKLEDDLDVDNLKTVFVI